MNGPEYFEIVIEKMKVKELLDVFCGDYQHLANHLKLMNDRMVLVNPKFGPSGEEIPQASDEPADDVVSPQIQEQDSAKKPDSPQVAASNEEAQPVE